MYNPYQYQSPLQYPAFMQQQSQNNNNGITWVQGEAGAKAYPVGAGSSMILMDSEAENFYIKSTDVSGMPQPLRKFQYKEVLENHPTEIPPVAQAFDSSKFVTREEFEQRIEELSKRRPNEYKKKEDTTNGKSLI